MPRSLQPPCVVVVSALGLMCSIAAGQEARPVSLAIESGELELVARWRPLADTVYGFEAKYPLVRDLAPAVERQAYGPAAFRPFLPSRPVSVGDVWPVRVADVLPLLRQFHPGATDEMHHDHGWGVSAPGAFACLRALDEGAAEILVRVHADFRLDGDGLPGRSSWYTPAQFEGRLQLDRAARSVKAFALGVPDQRANVDVNITTEQGTMADIGRIPEMVLEGGSFAALAEGARTMADADARAALAEAFYPFASVPWMDLATARARSLATGKPLHVIALFGSLLDESC